MRRETNSANFFPLPDSSLPPCLHLHQAFNLQKISVTLHSFCFQGVFLVFLHLFTCFLWMVVDECRSPILSGILSLYLFLSSFRVMLCLNICCMLIFVISSFVLKCFVKCCVLSYRVMFLYLFTLNVILLTWSLN